MRARENDGMTRREFLLLLGRCFTRKDDPDTETVRAGIGALAKAQVRTVLALILVMTFFVVLAARRFELRIASRPGCTTISCMQKTEIYSWRLSPHLKAQLEEAAQAEQKSLAELLAEISENWLRQSHRLPGSEEERQRRLREAALPFLGMIEGTRSDRAESARAEVRSRIARRHAR